MNDESKDERLLLVHCGALMWWCRITSVTTSAQAQRASLIASGEEAAGNTVFVLC